MTDKHKPAAPPEGQVERLKIALRWALLNGQKGFWNEVKGDGTWYHCRFCHAVANNPTRLRHEDSCEYFHAKKEAV
jgi:hypothetical protein